MATAGVEAMAGAEATGVAEEATGVAVDTAAVVAALGVGHMGLVAETQLIPASGGDRMSNLGAGLGNIDWGQQQLTKFEKKYVPRLAEPFNTDVAAFTLRTEQSLPARPRRSKRSVTRSR